MSATTIHTGVYIERGYQEVCMIVRALNFHHCLSRFHINHHQEEREPCLNTLF
jgi:hypothetical protein